MERDSIVAKLQGALDGLEIAMESLLTNEEALEEAKRVLREEEIAYVLGGLLDGKNAEMRQAQLEQKTEGLRKHVQALTDQVRRSRAKVEYRREVLSTWRAIAYLYAGGR